MEMLGGYSAVRAEDPRLGDDGDDGDDLLWADMLALLESADPSIEDASMQSQDTAMDYVLPPLDGAGGASAPHEAWPGVANPVRRSPTTVKQEQTMGEVAPTVTPTAMTPAMPLSLASVAQSTSTPSATEIRRMKNREFMRGARQRHREELKRMKWTVESLEKKYAELCLRSEEDIGQSRSVPSSPASPSSALSAPRRKPKKPRQPEQSSQGAQLLYSQAVEMAKQLGAENLFLRAAIQDKATWKRRLHRILETGMPPSVLVDGMHMRSAFGSRPSMPTRMGYLPLDTLDPDAARSIFGFTPLTEEGVNALILDNSDQMNSVRTQLESLQRIGDSHLLTRQVFGWDVVQRVTQNSIMEFMFTKRFSGMSARDIMHGTWANDMELEKFRKVKRDVKRLEVLQEANANAYILGRDVRAPDNSTVFRSVFLRYLIETTQALPNPKSRRNMVDGSASESEDTEAPVLKASGFILGTHSVNRDWSQSGYASSNIPKLPDCDLLGLDDHEKLVWANLALSIEFLDVEDPVTGETYQRARWMGRTDYKSSADALRNTVDILSGCLRWELLLISPALNLISLDLS
jgi:hypothetical protein